MNESYNKSRNSYRSANSGSKRERYMKGKEDKGEKRFFKSNSDRPNERRGGNSEESNHFHGRKEPDYRKYTERPKRNFDRVNSENSRDSFKGKTEYKDENRDKRQRVYKSKDNEGSKYERGEWGKKKDLNYPFKDKRPGSYNRREDSETRFQNAKRDKDYVKSNFKEERGRAFKNEITKEEKEVLRQKHYSKKKIWLHRLKNEDEKTELRLNRYISMGGVCSRRDADELIKSGRVKVNGEIVQTVGVKIHKSDRVEVDNVIVIPERKVYLVLNKPKDYVTTVEDPMERKTVMSLVEKACKERVYPIGRLDRQTTGVLLFTNDGDLAKKLTHPKYEHKKIYHVFLNKVVSENDLQNILEGVELEDGFIRADEISYASEDRTEVGIEIHSGKNRIVRRIFEHFGYEIVKLDRVYFAGITKKNLPRGKWRFLTPQEVEILKYY